MKEILAKDKQKQLVFLCLEDVCFLIKRIVIFGSLPQRDAQYADNI